MALHRPVDLLIKSGTIVTPTDMFSADVAVADGKIVAIGKGTHLQGADQLINAEGKFLLPGVIDTHVHFVTTISPSISSRRSSRVSRCRCKSSYVRGRD